MPDTHLGHPSAASTSKTPLSKPISQSTPVSRRSSLASGTIPKVGLPSVEDYESHHKTRNKPLVYNPYGTMGAQQFRETNGKTGLYNADPMDDQDNQLPYPIDMPNDHLPPEFQMEHQDLFDEYEFFKTDRGDIGTGASASVKKVHRKGHTREVIHYP
ncbi:unnamed protein product [Ambrosiozyma monospora]|uniref:Unnamed protein product n=1 Tax=Ambrosiozyma monospora TaxID=43982 RepID=A0ACB5UCA5_AMBMO|nr:unnamed protein product [Ambrosiozyma monospora]